MWVEPSCSNLTLKQRRSGSLVSPISPVETVGQTRGALRRAGRGENAGAQAAPRPEERPGPFLQKCRPRSSTDSILGGGRGQRTQPCSRLGPFPLLGPPAAEPLPAAPAAPALALWGQTLGWEETGTMLAIRTPRPRTRGDGLNRPWWEQGPPRSGPPSPGQPGKGGRRAAPRPLACRSRGCSRGRAGPALLFLPSWEAPQEPKPHNHQPGVSDEFWI